MQWSSATPGLLIIMIDQSGSMLTPYENGESRTVFATKAVNRILDTIIQKNFNGNEPKNRCFVAIIGYNRNVREIASGYLKDLDASPLRIETVKQKIADGAGGLLEIDKKMPIWVDPITEDGPTNMKGAFEMAKQLIDKWTVDYPNNPAPVIINISDGLPYFDGKNLEVCMEETIAVVDQIKAITTKDGKVQIFNAMIGDAEHYVFPTTLSEIKGEEAKFLFRISTEIPASYKGAADKNGLSFEQGAYGMISHADGVELISLIDFGSSKGQGDAK